MQSGNKENSIKKYVFLKEDFSKTAFVGNLPFNIEEEEVRSEFE